MLNFSRSALQYALLKRKLDITRLLVDRGAEGDYVSALGWTPLFYLLVDHAEAALLNQSTDTLDFLRILACDCSITLDLDLRDREGMSVLDHVARHGRGEELQWLLRLGAKLAPDGQTSPWKMTGSAISQAIVTGNLSTFTALLPYHEVDDEYGDGWTMLELAACLGRDHMVRHLLAEGAEEFYIDLDKELDGDSDTAADAHSMNHDKYLAYLQALQDFGRIVVKLPDTDQEDGEDMEDIFWDADEILK